MRARRRRREASGRRAGGMSSNLPTKNFYSDDAVPLDAVPVMARDLIGRMHTAGHPHILGSECDVLHVPEASETIRRKVEAMLAA